MVVLTLQRWMPTRGPVGTLDAERARPARFAWPRGLRITAHAQFPETNGVDDRTSKRIDCAEMHARIFSARHAVIRRLRGLAGLAILFVLEAISAPAFACGASGGAAGVSSCSLQEHQEELRPKWRIGAGYSYTSTAIRFDSHTVLDETRHTVLATLDYAPTPVWTFEVGAGALLGGSLRDPGASYDFSPGFLAVLGAGWRIVDPDGPRPFVALTGQLSFVAASTRLNGSSSSPSIGYHALDARLGALAGWPIEGTFTPYVLARAFGGPVYWEYQGNKVTGTDTHHYQLGGGALVKIGRKIDLFVEGVPLGEQAISAGAGVLF